MIKLFRNIRKKQAAENKLWAYSRYAIGEIVLVVIGILIALQINNWNENQKLKANTFIYVNNLINDLKKDTLMYRNYINSTQLKFNASKDIHDFIIENKAITDTSTFIVNLQAIGRLNLPVINANTYKDLISTGNMKLINDNKSIDAIRQYYSNDSDWWYNDYKNQLVNGYLPLAVDAIPMHLHEEILKKEIGDTFTDQELFLTSARVEDFTKKDVDDIMTALKNNREFAFQLKRITRSHLIQIKFLKVNFDNATSLLEKLNQWLSTNKN